jgi:hypothetical protein
MSDVENDMKFIASKLAHGYYAGIEFKDSETKRIAIEAWVKGFEYALRQKDFSHNRVIDIELF